MFFLIPNVRTAAGRNPVKRTMTDLRTPDDGMIQNNLGYILMRAGRPTEAIEPLEMAVKREPRAARVRTNLANAYQQAGQPDRALAQVIMLRFFDVEAANRLEGELAKTATQK